MALFKAINETLIRGESLPIKNRDQFLVGNWKGHRECHVAPDWLLIYRVNEELMEIEYVRTGSHTDLFKE